MPSRGGRALRAGRVELNPPLRFRAEKGTWPFIRGTSEWLDLDTKEPLSHTYWSRGWVDYGGDRPDVWVEDELTEAEYNEQSESGRRGPGKKIGFLLHPPKWREVAGDLDPAFGFLANVHHKQRGKLLAVALAVTWDVPVYLELQPRARTNPRGWFQGYGAAWGRRVAGEVEVVDAKHDRGWGLGPSGKPIFPVYDEILISYTDEPPGRGWERLD